MSDEALENLLHEDRRFPPPDDLAANANVTAGDLRSRPPPTSRASGPSRPSGSAGTPSRPRCWTGATRRSRSGSPTARSTPRTTAWTGTSRPATATGWRSTSRASRATPATITYAELTTEVKQAANALIELGVKAGRPGRDLPADDPRGRGGDAGLRPDRRAAHRGLRRLLRRRAGHPDPGLRGRGGDHRRRRLPARRRRRR